MKLNVSNGTNIPKDAIFSIKSNTVRRQDRFSSGRTFKFPKGTGEGYPLKIDILVPLGSAFIEVLPDDGSSCTATFEHPSGDPISDTMTCDLKIGGGAPSRKPEADLMKPVDVKNYLGEFKVLEFLQAAIGAVIKTRPQNPFSYMATLIASGHLNASTAAGTELGFALEEALMEELASPPQAQSNSAKQTEVYLHNGINIPTDAIVSIRSTAARRQDFFSRGRPFKFPRGTAEGQSLLIDVMIPYATAYVVTTSADEATYRVTFMKTSGVTGKEPIQCDLRASNRSLSAAKTETAKDYSSYDAQRYLEEFKVLEFVQAILHAVIKERPSDPIGYIATICTYADTSSRGAKANILSTVGVEKKAKKAETTTKQTKSTKKSPPADSYEEAMAQATQLAEEARKAREVAEKAAKAAEAAAAAAMKAQKLADSMSSAR